MVRLRLRLTEGVLDVGALEHHAFAGKLVHAADRGGARRRVVGGGYGVGVGVGVGIGVGIGVAWVGKG